MPILYTVISRGNTILCKCADCIGNFSEVTETLISKIQLTNHKLTYTHGNYLFHYICADKLIYMCISDKEFERLRAFVFLSEIKKKFLLTYGLTAATAPPYAMNTDFAQVLSSEMKFCSKSNPIAKVQSQIDELKDILVKNIESITERGEKLELLVKEAENLRDNSSSFVQASRVLKRRIYWRNVKILVLICLFLLFISYVITSMFCGGLTWSKCI